MLQGLDAIDFGPIAAPAILFVTLLPEGHPAYEEDELAWFSNGLAFVTAIWSHYSGLENVSDQIPVL